MFSHSSKKEIRLCSYLLSLFVLRKCLLQKHKLIMQEKWLKFSGGAKVAKFVFGKGCKALAEIGPAQDCICPIQAQPQHEDLLSFAVTQLCSEQCPSTEKKKSKTRFWFFPSTPQTTCCSTEKQQMNQWKPRSIPVPWKKGFPQQLSGKEVAEVHNRLGETEKEERSATGMWSAAIYSPSHGQSRGETGGGL